MIFGQQMVSLMAAAFLAQAGEGAAGQRASAIRVEVRVEETAAIDSGLEGEERRRAIDATAEELRKEARAGLEQTAGVAEALSRAGRGPWVVEVCILEWIGAAELRGVLGLGVPGVAVEARLFDLSRSRGVAEAQAEFPPAAERLVAEKFRRVLAPAGAARRAAEWAGKRIHDALEPKHPQDKE